MTREKTFTITMDNQHLDVRQGLTILEAAKKHGIYIPVALALEGLPSYGACRMCIVEVDGLRGFPTACTTPVEEGMVIRTDSAEIKALRQEILKLVLSEHPASCLFCGGGGLRPIPGHHRKTGIDGLPLLPQRRPMRASADHGEGGPHRYVLPRPISRLPRREGQSLLRPRL